MSIKTDIKNLALKAKEASSALALTSSYNKNQCLKEMARQLVKQQKKILKANQKDLAYAKKQNLSPAFLDRLQLTSDRIKQMSDSLLHIASLNDPIGEVIKERKRPNGLLIRKVRVPIGVIGIIYESRPNVTSDVAGLCLKSGNSVILRGGKEAINSNKAVFAVLNTALKLKSLPEGTINLIKTTNRAAVKIMLKQVDLIDLIIPRGGEGLIKEVTRLSRIPVLKHNKGLCHIYVDNQADLNMAFKVCFNAKVQRPGVCNAMETLLVHEGIARRFLPGMVKKLEAAGVEIRGCSRAKKIVRWVKSAVEKDWKSEYLDLILSVKVVSDIDHAIAHINKYSSGLSEAIITDSKSNAHKFWQAIDSACLYVNASTRFTDGGQFGLGAEIGISTDKIHARGPVALEELTSYKYVIFGKGQIRES